jgi:hypothetical protein
MSAEIIMFVPRPNPHREATRPETMEQMAAEIFNVALAHWTDTAPSEYTPPKESA